MRFPRKAAAGPGERHRLVEGEPLEVPVPSPLGKGGGLHFDPLAVPDADAAPAAHSRAPGEQRQRGTGLKFDLHG